LAGDPPPPPPFPSPPLPSPPLEGPRTFMGKCNPLQQLKWSHDDDEDQPCTPRPEPHLLLIFPPHLDDLEDWELIGNLKGTQYAHTLSTREK